MFRWRENVWNRLSIPETQNNCDLRIFFFFLSEQPSQLGITLQTLPEGVMGGNKS